MSDPISPAVRAVLDLFAGELAAVKFPDLDAGILRAAAEAATLRAEQLSQAEAALDQARAQLGEAQEALLLKAHRALAYAKVFAEENAALASQLESLTLPRAPRRASSRALELQPTGESSGAESEPRAVEAAPTAPKRRGRPPKGAISTSAPLFGPITETDPSATSAAASD
jgi:hypothetical protein